MPRRYLFAVASLTLPPLRHPFAELSPEHSGLTLEDLKEDAASSACADEEAHLLRHLYGDLLKKGGQLTLG